MARLSPRLRLPLLIGLAATSLVVSLELTLQIAARVLPDYARAQESEDRPFLVLAMGDSHTYGVIEPPAMSYPAQLQRRLEAAEPGRFAVINLGIPGSNTFELRQRLPRAIGQYDPDLLLVWAGVNNQWNIEGREEVRRGGAQRWLGWSRLYRFYRVWQGDPGRSKDPGKEIHRDGKPQNVHRLDPEGGDEVVWSVDHGFGTEVVESSRSEQPLSLEEAEALGYADYTAIAQLAAEADIPVVFLQYPLDYEGFGAANRAIERAAKESGSLVFATSGPVRRVPREKRKWLWGAHPNRYMYGEVALDLEPVVRSYARAASADEESSN